MDISPQRVRTAEFRTVKKGLDPDEVRSFLTEVADELERAQNQSTAMEARARAAVARLQEISESTPAPAPEPVAAAPVTQPEPAASHEVTASVDQAETISRTLLLAQRTADTAIAEAEAEAARLRSEAESEATRTIESAREMTDRLLEEAREEARRKGETERIQVESEVNALLARRDFLESDVDHLESFLVEERSRLRDAATSLLEMVERVPSGLGSVRRPLLSASDDEVEAPAAADDAAAPVATTAPSAGGHAVDPAHESADAAGTDDAAETDDAATGDDTPADTSAPLLPATEELRPIFGGRRESESATPSGDATSEAGADRPRRTVDPDQLVIQTDIADDGPTGFSYDDTGR